MDPLSVAASSIALATFATQVAKGVRECIEETRSSEQNLNLICSELITISKSSRRLADTLRNPSLAEIGHRSGLASDLQKLYSDVQKLNGDCSGLLQDVSKILGKVKESRLARGFLRKPVAAAKLSSKSSTLERMRRLLQTYQSSIQVSMSTIGILITADVNLAIGHIDQKLQENLEVIKTEILTLRFDMVQPFSNGGTIDANCLDPFTDLIKETDMSTRINHLQNLATSAESVLSTASEHFASISGSVANGSISGLNDGQRQGLKEWMSTVGAAEEPDAESDNDDFQKTLIQRYFALGYKSYLSSDWAAASTFFTTYLDNREGAENWPVEWIAEAKTLLGISFAEQQEFMEARRVYLSLKCLADHESFAASQRSQILHNLAEMSLICNKFDEAQRYSIRAANGRRKAFGKMHSRFHDSVELVAIVFEEQEGYADARVWRSFLPPSYQNEQNCRFVKGWASQKMTSVKKPAAKSSCPDGQNSPKLTFTPFVLQTNLEAAKGFCQSLMFSSDGSAILSAGITGTVQAWHVASGRVWHKLKANQACEVGYSYRGDISRAYAEFSPDGRKIVSIGSRNRIVYIWDAVSGVLQRSLNGPKPTSTFATFSPNGSVVVAAGLNKTLTLWDVSSGALEHVYRVSLDNMSGITISADGSKVASSEPIRYTIQVWDILSGTMHRTLQGHTAMVHSVNFSPDSSQIVSASRDGTVRIWDTRSGAQVWDCGQAFESYGCAIFSPDGLKVVCGSSHLGMVQIWDVRSGTLLQEFEGSTGGVTRLAMSQDGHKIAAGSFKALEIWEDVENSREERGKG